MKVNGTAVVLCLILTKHDEYFLTDVKRVTNTSHPEGMALGLWFKPMAEALQSYGIDGASLFAKAGIDLESLTDPWKLYPVSIRNRAWKLAVEATGDACFGLRVGACARPPMLGNLGYSLLASSTLLAMFNRLERFMMLVSTDGIHKTEEINGEYRILFTLFEPNLRQEAIDGWLMLLIKLCRDMYSPDFRPLKLELQRPASARCVQEMERAFNCPVSFSSKQIALYISTHEMQAKLPGALRELALQHDRVLSSYLAKHQQSDVLTRVRVSITELLPSGTCSKVEIANKFYMSSRTLQSKLSNAGTSYYNMLDQVRQELALEYIRQPHRNLHEITFLLGFADSSSFSRAFKRWTGVSPGQYKN